MKIKNNGHTFLIDEEMYEKYPTVHVKYGNTDNPQVYFERTKFKTLVKPHKRGTTFLNGDQLDVRRKNLAPRHKGVERTNDGRWSVSIRLHTSRHKPCLWSISDTHYRAVHERYRFYAAHPHIRPIYSVERMEEDVYRITYTFDRALREGTLEIVNGDEDYANFIRGEYEKMDDYIIN